MNPRNASLRQFVLTLFLAVPLMGCGSSGGEAPPAPAPLPPPSGGGPDAGLPPLGAGQSLITKAEWTALEASIVQILEAPGTCPDAPGCEPETFVYAPPNVTAGDKDHVILVIDGGDSIAAGLRYGNRVLGRYKLNEGGTLEEIRPSYVIAKDAGKIYQSLAVPGKIIPQALTQDLFSRFYTRYYNTSWSQYHSNHLNQVFNILASYVPQAYFVVADVNTVDEAGRDDLCSLSADAKTRIKARYALLAKQVEALVTKYRVDFINYSIGYSKEPLTRNGWFSCPSVPESSDIDDYLRITTDYLKALSSYPGVTLVQAGTAGTDRLRPDDPSAPSDCADIPGRVRASFFLAKDSGLGRFGHPGAIDNLTSYIPKELQNAEACTDLYVNFGFEWNGDEGTPGVAPIQAGTFGLDRRFLRSLLSPETSWIAPLLLGHLVHVQDQVWLKQGVRPAGSALLDAARGGDARVKLIDPLRNDQFSRFTIE